MASPATFNRNAIGRLWNLSDIPAEWVGFQILLGGDTDQNLVIDQDEADRIDWIAFSEAVGDFQKLAKMSLADRDSKLGQGTLKQLQKFFGASDASVDAGDANIAGGESAAKVLREFGDLSVFAATTPVSQPPGPPLTGRTLEERVVCRMWNDYGASIKQEAEALGIPTESALGVFFVESKQAYDLATGLIIIRYEPHIFRRKSGKDVPAKRAGQNAEWDNFARAFDVHQEAALLSCSYGLPQLMGFNFGVTKHGNARDMFLAFQDSCSEQVQGFFGFVRKNNITKAIKNKDWRAFASVYNGPGAVDDYSGKLNRAMKVIDSLKQDGARF
jgi:hypothetical protein